MFYDDAFGLLRVLVVGTLAYAVLVMMLRVSGKRTLASMNAFDFIVTVALGSTMATVLLSKDVLLAEGVLGFALLIALQFVIARLSQQVPFIEKLVKSEPRLLLIDGVIDARALRDERMSRRELEAAVRKSGLGDFADIAAVVLETDGTLSVISRDKAGARTVFPQPA
ncbi:MAG: YetF domain-containing protein [Novosphingobium sp.]